MSLLLVDRAKLVSDCTQWLDVCEASCCKSMSFVINNSQALFSIQKGQIYKLYLPPMEKSLVDYYRYHGVRVWGDSTLNVRLNNYEIIGDRLIVYKRCNRLSKNNLCLEHESKPDVCKALTIKTCRDPQFRLTKNCLFKYKTEEL